jgi:hypothetical protein|tara:strand:- start:1974 stop:2459 length:486 start_codon:yes stop_codon:yes gene_type:complete
MSTQFYYIPDRIFPKAPMTPAWVNSIRQHAHVPPDVNALIIYHIQHEPDTTQLRIVLDYVPPYQPGALLHYYRFLEGLAQFFNATLPPQALDLIRDGMCIGTTHTIGSTFVLDLVINLHKESLFSPYGDCYGEAKTLVIQMNELYKEKCAAWDSIVDRYTA